MTKLINLTPHAVVFVDTEGNTVLEVKPSGQIARVSVRTEQIGTVDVNGITIPKTASVYGEVENLPAPEDDTIYIVSSLVATRANRADVLIPNESVRDAERRIIGCKSLGLV